MAKAAIVYVFGVVMSEEKDRELTRKKNKNAHLLAPSGLPFKVDVGLSNQVNQTKNIS